jgi:uncharacterized membrane protein
VWRAIDVSFLNHETKARSFAKMITYRVTVAALLAAITFYVTGNASTTALITVVFNVGGSLLYYGFERLWDAVPWGRA